MLTTSLCLNVALLIATGTLVQLFRRSRRPDCHTCPFVAPKSTAGRVPLPVNR